MQKIPHHPLPTPAFPTIDWTDLNTFELVANAEANRAWKLSIPFYNRAWDIRE